MKRIIFTVTNDLTYDQRMMRICTTLAGAGYHVLLVGRKLRESKPLRPAGYAQKRIFCFFSKGKLFYAEYNIRLFFFLLFKKTDAVCAIDLDTILPCYLVSRLKGIKRVYDAHEYFTQMDEVISRPAIYRIWHGIEKRMLPRFVNGYTVGQSISAEFKKKYGVNYKVIRNVPWLTEIKADKSSDRFILYQGAVNKGRGLEKLVEAMNTVPVKLIVCGEGNFSTEMREAIRQNNLTDKVLMKGMLEPGALKEITRQAYIAVNPFQRTGLNQYLSLSNKFFDYIHAGIPQVTMNFPEYKKINDAYQVALLIDDVEPQRIAQALNNLLNNDVLYNRLKENCIKARLELNWQNEEKKLMEFYQSLLH